MGKVSIPQCLDDVSASWLTEVLLASGALTDGGVDTVDVSPIAEGVGLMSQLGRLTIRYVSGSTPELPPTMVLKLPSRAPMNRQMASQYGLFEREARFYRELAPSIGIATPQVFANFYDTDSEDAVLLLEEIVEARGGDTFTDLSDADVRTAIDALAGLHARWWEGSDNVPPEWLPRLDGATWASHRSMFARAWEAFLDSEAAQQHPRLADLGEALIPRIHAVQQRLSQPPVTVVHFDFRLSNLFLRSGRRGDEVVAIDWQPLSVARGAYDLGYFVSQSLPVAQRRRLERDLLSGYERVLVDAAIPGVSHVGLCDDYRLSVAYTASYAVATSLIDLANATGREFAEETLIRAAAAVGDLEVIEMVRQVGADALE